METGSFFLQCQARWEFSFHAVKKITGISCSSFTDFMDFLFNTWKNVAVVVINFSIVGLVSLFFSLPLFLLYQTLLLFQSCPYCNPCYLFTMIQSLEIFFVTLSMKWYLLWFHKPENSNIFELDIIQDKVLILLCFYILQHVIPLIIFINFFLCLISLLFRDRLELKPTISFLLTDLGTTISSCHL